VRTIINCCLWLLMFDVMFQVIAIIQFIACAPDGERLLANVSGEAVVEAWILCSAVFNIVATGLLAWRILGNRQTRLSFRASGQSSRIQSVLEVLVESAFLYTVSGIVFAVLNIVNAPAAAIFSALFNNLAVRSAVSLQLPLAEWNIAQYLNPAVIALRVALSQSSQQSPSIALASRPRLSATTGTYTSSKSESKTLISGSAPLKSRIDHAEA
jgi:hypothetical protein